MQEIVLMEGIANSITSKGFVKNGHGVLTNQRFIYNKHSLGKLLAIGVLVNLTKGQYEYDIPREDIETIDVARYKLGHALCITRKDGEVLKYGIAKTKDWQAAIERFKNPPALFAPEAISNPAATVATPTSAEAAPLAAPPTSAPAQTPAVAASKNFCSNCGAKASGEGLFCSSCGSKL